MNSDRKMLYISVGINFLFGIVIGIFLFYGQLRADVAVFESGTKYSFDVDIYDFIRVFRDNVLWFFAIFVVHNILPISIVHPVAIIRGCCCSFSVMYMIQFVGLKETAVTVLPQCISILPVMAIFSVNTVLKRKKLVVSGKEPFSMQRKEVVAVFVLSAVVGIVEVILFKVMGAFLF